MPAQEVDLASGRFGLMRSRPVAVKHSGQKTRRTPRRVARRQVVSAGGVVLRERAGGLEVLAITIRSGRIWSLPKGQVEKGERYAQTAVREVREETGIEAKVRSSLGRIRYHFVVKDDTVPVTVDKEVHYFLMRYQKGEARPQLAEVEGVAWLPVAEAEHKLSYANEKRMLAKALVQLAAEKNRIALGAKGA